MSFYKEFNFNYFEMMNNDPNYEKWFKDKYDSNIDVVENYNKLEEYRYHLLFQNLQKIKVYEEYIKQINKDIKIYKLLKIINDDKLLRDNFVNSLKKIQNNDIESYLNDKEKLGKYAYSYYYEFDLYKDILNKMEKASQGKIPQKRELGSTNKCFQSYEFFETKAKLLAKDDISSLNSKIIDVTNKEEIERNLKEIKAKSSLNNEFYDDLNALYAKISRLEKEYGHNLYDESEIIKKEIKYIQLAIVDMMTLGQKMKHYILSNADLDTEFDFDFDF